MEIGMDLYTRFYLKWVPNRDLPHSTGNSAQSYRAAWTGGAFGENGCSMAESLLLST